MRTALLALAVTAVLIAIACVAPWRTPHPNHVFIFEMLQSLEHDGIPTAEANQPQLVETRR